MTARRMPRLKEIRPLFGLRTPTTDLLGRRLESAQTIDDLARLARRRTPRPVFDYADGGAERETSLVRNVRAFQDVEFRPRVFRDVSNVDTSCEILGGPSALPFGIAPIGFTRLMHTAGERAGARVAARAGIPFSLSTMGTTSAEDVRNVAPEARHWFQLYLWKDRARSADLVHRAAEAGFDTLLITADTPVAGARLRDVRNGFSIPPKLTPRALAQISTEPRWWLDLLTTDPLTFANLQQWSGTVADLLAEMFDPSVGIDDFRWLRELWPGRVVVKGVQSVADATLLAAEGADGIVLSNHGGRQLDRAPTSLELLPEVVDAVGGQLAVILDSGVRSGADIVAAVALGADFVLVGRAYLYGLMAGGERGADRAIEILRTDVVRTMQLLGADNLSALGREHVQLSGASSRRH